MEDNLFGLFIAKKQRGRHKYLYGEDTYMKNHSMFAWLWTDDNGWMGMSQEDDTYSHLVSVKNSQIVS